MSSSAAKLACRKLVWKITKTGGCFVVQVLTWVVSYDGEQPPEPLAITAAGAARAVSGITHPPPPRVKPPT